MDVPINKTHRILLDAALPSTIEDLKNPTEDYVVNLLTTFLSRFCINMSVIDQPLAEQYQAMTYYNDSDIINLINLNAVLILIFDKIYLTDFCITDITNPGQKRFRRQAKFLANFVLYMMQKKLEVNDRMDNIQARSMLLEELKDKKTRILESINDKAVHKAKQLKQANKIENDIQHMHLKLEQLNKRESELEMIENDINKEYQKARDLRDSVKTTAEKLSKTIAEKQLEIVDTPKEYQLRLDKLEEQKKEKLEERDTMQEAIKEKKQSIKQIEMKVNFVQRVSDEFASLKAVYERLKNQKAQSDSIKNEIDSLNNTWDELKNKLAVHKDQVNIEINELQSHREGDIAPLCDMYNKLLSEKKSKKIQLEANKVCFNEKCLERNELEGNIRKKEEEITTFLHGCQEIYNNEIANELELQKVWKEE